MFLPLTSQQKALFNALGSDWFLLFLQPHLHPSTLKLGLGLLTQFLSSPSQQSGFRESVLPATLIDSMEEPSALIGTLTIRVSLPGLLIPLLLSNPLLSFYCFCVWFFLLEQCNLITLVITFGHFTIKSSFQTTSKLTPGPWSAPAPHARALTFCRVC